MPAPNPLLDLPPFPPDRYAVMADRLKRLLGTQSDVIFVQAEAILALEAAATSLGRPGLVALNIVTSHYGGYFGDWLRRAGSEVETLRAEPGQPITTAAVAEALRRRPDIGLVALVHAETSSGILNPLPEIAALVRDQGALFVVDAVASVGGHPLEVDAGGIDLCVIGPQKGLSGPSGLSPVIVSPRAWAAMAAHPAPGPSNLALLDIKANWLDAGRGAVPGMPSALEWWALDAALDRVEDETIAGVVTRHEQAARAARAGIAALGLTPWTDEATASTLVTTFHTPAGLTVDHLITAAAKQGVALTSGFGEVREKLVRLDHTGQRARFERVLTGVVSLGRALQTLGHSVPIGAAADAVSAAY